MATFSDLGTIAKDPGFQARVDHAMTVAAVAVAAEGAVTNHAKRLAFAAKVFDGTYSVERAAVAVLTNSTIAGEAVLASATFGVPDSDMQFAVNSLFDALSGVG